MAQGVVQDFHEALTWFRKAADQGYAQAQFTLGLMCANGKLARRSRDCRLSSPLPTNWTRCRLADRSSKFAPSLRLPTVSGASSKRYVRFCGFEQLDDFWVLHFLRPSAWSGPRF